MGKPTDNSSEQSKNSLDNLITFYEHNIKEIETAIDKLCEVRAGLAEQLIKFKVIKESAIDL